MGQYSRINDVIITDLDINTYDRAEASVGEPTESELDSTEGIIVEIGHPLTHEEKQSLRVFEQKAEKCCTKAREKTE